MSAKVFVDTNVLVYSRDASEPKKQRAAAAWMAVLWEKRAGRLSFQVLQEFYVTVTAKLSPGMDREAARRDVQALLAWKPLSVGPQMLTGAWHLQDRYQLPFWDALIAAAAQAARCRYLLSEDFQEGLEMGGLQVVNPFGERPEILDDIQ
jgi:predicted nucleic acid-binding protein